MDLQYRQMAEVRRVEWEATVREIAAARRAPASRPARRALGLALIHAGNRLIGSSDSLRARGYAH